MGGRSARGHVSPHVELLAILLRRFREPIEFGALAAHIGVHRSHLTRQFTHEFGCSPQTYVSLKRAAWAAQEVANGAGSMAEIAANAGFADQSHCTRTFKRAFGDPPLRWRRGARS